MLGDFLLLELEEDHASMFIILYRFLNLLALEIAIRQLAVQLSRLVIIWTIVALVNLEGAQQTLAGLFRHIRSLLRESEKDVLIPNLIVELWKHLRFVQEALFVHEDGLVVLAHLRSDDCDIEAYLGDHQRTHTIDLVLFALHADLGLLFRLNFADHAEGNFKVGERFHRVLPLEIAVGQLIADVYVDHGILVNDFILNCLLGVFKFVDGVTDLSTVHDALGIACLRSDVIVDAKLEYSQMVGIQVRDLLQSSVVNLPSIVDFANIIEYLLCLFVVTLSKQALGVQLIDEQYIVLKVQLAQITLLTQFLEQRRQEQILVRALLHEPNYSQIVASLLKGLQKHIRIKKPEANDLNVNLQEIKVDFVQNLLV